MSISQGSSNNITQDYIDPLTSSHSRTVEVPVTVQEASQERYTAWCWNPPKLKCSRYKIVMKTVKKMENKTKTELEKHCCPGFFETENQCSPHCEQECVNGECSGPNMCTCQQGWFGHQCDQLCDPNKWGVNCTLDCLCKNEATCNTNTGTCKCSNGYIGQYCDEKCPEDKFGDKCEELCRCENGGTCNHINGECTCPAGWAGP